MALCVSSGVLTFAALSRVMQKLLGVLRRRRKRTEDNNKKKKSSPSSSSPPLPSSSVPVPPSFPSSGSPVNGEGTNDDAKMDMTVDSAKTDSLTVSKGPLVRDDDGDKKDNGRPGTSSGKFPSFKYYYYKFKKSSGLGTDNSSKMDGHKAHHLYYPKGTHYVYVLKLVGGKYYVGESRNLATRLKTHFHGKGAKWTKLHKPVAVMQVLEAETEEDEKHKTYEMMKRYGDAVRGSIWCQQQMRSPPAELRTFFNDKEGRPWKPIVDQ